MHATCSSFRRASRAHCPRRNPAAQNKRPRKHYARGLAGQRLSDPLAPPAVLVRRRWCAVSARRVAVSMGERHIGASDPGSGAGKKPSYKRRSSEAKNLQALESKLGLDLPGDAIRGEPPALPEKRVAGDLGKAPLDRRVFEIAGLND